MSRGGKFICYSCGCEMDRDYYGGLCEDCYVAVEDDDD